MRGRSERPSVIAKEPQATVAISTSMPLVVLLALCLLVRPAEAKYGGGIGEPNDPYLIYTAEQMNTIGAEPNDWDKHFKLMADIDLSAYSGTQFNIIGFRYGDAFTGVFDGNGHTVSNFRYISPGRGFCLSGWHHDRRFFVFH